MGADLTNAKGDYFRWNTLAWRQILAFAKEFGWKPKHNPERGITAEDAKNMAKALKLLLGSADDPKAQAKIKKVDRMRDPVSEWMKKSLKSKGKDKEINFFGPERIDLSEPMWFKKVQGFIEFCKEGGFSVSA